MNESAFEQNKVSVPEMNTEAFYEQSYEVQLSQLSAAKDRLEKITSQSIDSEVTDSVTRDEARAIKNLAREITLAAKSAMFNSAHPYKSAIRGATPEDAHTNAEQVREIVGEMTREVVEPLLAALESVSGKGQTEEINALIQGSIDHNVDLINKQISRLNVR